MKLTVEQKTELSDRLDAFDTTYDGFTNVELHLFRLKFYPDINMEKVNEAMFCNTCLSENGILVNYKHDVYIAFVCGLENRDLNVEEWD
jgi:hypothetical protein|tara:strand:- start:1624 stop:1890 length:267 start_codon:yes stop_codon:yes gene_type:complete